MGRKLTQKEYEQRVYECVGNKYSVISEYTGKSNPITLHCNDHNIDFTVTAECFMRGKDNIRSSCPHCSQEKRNQSKISVECAYCGKQFYISPSQQNKSKSGLHFCCREHKDLAQRVDSGKQFDILRPSHYGDGQCNYRQKAFEFYEHKCACCGYDEDTRILQVHHKDENRKNNDINNLIIYVQIVIGKLLWVYIN